MIISILKINTIPKQKMTTEYSIRNAHTGIILKIDSDMVICEETGLNQIYFEWDYENNILDNIAEKEFRFKLNDKKKNMFWIDELKKIADWKQGEYIYVETSQNCDGIFYVNSIKSKILKCGSNFNWYNIIIEPSGYVSMKGFNNYSTYQDDDIKYDFWVRVESFYNDKICNK